jgi:hypothetical protein
MEKLPILLITLGIGFGAGYFVRDASVEETQHRTDRKTATLPPVVFETEEPETGSEPAAATAVPTDGRIEPIEGAGRPAPKEAKESKEKKNPFAALFSGEGGDLIKGMAAIDAKTRARKIAAELGLDEERTKLLEEAFAAESARQLDGLGSLTEDGELDLEKLEKLEKPDGLMTEEMERDLAEFLNGHEIDSVRGEMKKEKEREEREAIESRVNDLGVGDLSDAQREQLRQLFRDRKKADEAEPREMSKEKIEQGKKLLEGELDTETIFKQMEEEAKKERELISQVLSPKQLKQYDAHKKAEMEEKKMGMELFGAMFKGAKGQGAVKIKLGGTSDEPKEDE